MSTVIILIFVSKCLLLPDYRALPAQLQKIRLMHLSYHAYLLNRRRDDEKCTSIQNGRAINIDRMTSPITCSPPSIVAWADHFTDAFVRKNVAHG